MSSFRDAFTKEQKKDNLLDYDDSASLYFGATILICILVPWTCRVISQLLWPNVNASGTSSVPPRGKTIKYCKCANCADRTAHLKKESLKWSNRFGKLFMLQFAVLVLLWLVWIRIVVLCADTKEIQSFDPFELLGVSMSATEKEIKKAFRVLSLKFHPDKNPNDPTAAAKFVMMTKAYQALTDEVSKRNYEKYGNPDGPGFMKVGIGLPRMLVEEDHQLFFLLIFFTVLLVVLPLIFIHYYRQQKRFAPNGVLLETLQSCTYYINEGFRIKNVPELFAASQESRELQLRPEDNEAMRPIIQAVDEPRKRQFQQPIIVRNYFLVLAHIHRKHNLMTLALRTDIDQLLRKSGLICQTMVEVSIVNNWFATVQSILRFQQSITQALGFKNEPLQQIPHFDELPKTKTKGIPSDLRELIRMPRDELQLRSKFDDHQMADVVAFLQHISQMEITAEVFVDDEKEMVAGDVATLKATLTRKNLQENEIMGPIHSAYLPEARYEQWWICLFVKSSGALLTFATTKSRERVIKEKMQFMLKDVGKLELTLGCYCDSYSGIDVTTDVTIKVHSPREVKRQVYVHPEDESLDDQPTLFQSMMGQIQEGLSSDEEDAGVTGDHEQSTTATERKTETSTNNTNGSADQEPSPNDDDDSSDSE
eukprot:Lankesteria_metandrocarpae@DN5177_c5_g1_i3.p1